MDKKKYRPSLTLTEDEAILDPEARIEWLDDGHWRVYSPWAVTPVSDERGTWFGGSTVSSITWEDGSVMMQVDLLRALEAARAHGKNRVRLADVPYVRKGGESWPSVSTS